MEPIHSFDSISDLLKALLGKGRKPISIRQMSRKLGYASDRTLGMVIQGQREMGADMLRRLADYAQLSSRDKEYVSLLSLRQKYQKLGKNTDSIERKLGEFKKKSSRERKVEAANLRETGRWYAFTVIEVLRFFDRPATVEEIFRYLRGNVSLVELRATLSGLSALGFVQTVGEGCYRALAEDEYISTPVDIPSTTVREIHRGQLLRALETLEEQAVSEREFIAKTILISSEKIPLLKKRAREILQQLSDEFLAPTAADAVAAQINLQFYQQSLSRAAIKKKS